MTPTLAGLPVYFPFADGALGYHCTECGYRCCKGAGFGGTRSEVVQLTKRYPRLAMFVNPQRDPEAPYVSLTNFAPSCFFLRDDGLCRIEADQGRTLKPYVCRTFPVNQIARIGGWFVADLNFLCPLRSVRAGDATVRYADTLVDLEASSEVPLAIPIEAEDIFPPAMIALEMGLRDRPIDDDLLTRLAVEDVASAHWEQPVVEPDPQAVEAQRAHLVRLRNTIESFVGIATHELPFARDFALVLPRMRLAILRQRRTPLADDVLARMGRHFVALAVWLEVVTELGTAIALGVIEQAFRNTGLLCELLGQLDRVPQLATHDDDSYQLTLYRTQEAELQRFLQFLHDENPERRLTLAGIFDALGIADPAVRVQLLQSFTPEAMGHILFEDQ